FIGIVDYIIGNQLVKLYLGQLDHADPNKKYVFIAILFLVGVNFVIMISTFLASNTAKKLEAKINGETQSQ
ncbi:hypothetical protein, partial [Bacillus sp. JJ1764]|uniref:hypothetical protein n=1 Tax=Bacillus sp. JJ1764 TaxID=3122964 RepID=UPI002FFE300A